MIYAVKKTKYQYKTRIKKVAKTEIKKREKNETKVKRINNNLQNIRHFTLANKIKIKAF